MAQNLVEYILDLKTQSAEKGLKVLNKTISITGKSLSVLKNAFLAVGASLTALTGAIGYAVKEVTDLVNELNDLSVRSGLATDTIAGLRFALVASGQSAEGLNEIIGAISGQFSQLSKEGSEVEKKLSQFGITVKDTNGNLRSNNDILLDVIKNITSLKDPSERSRRAVFLIGEAGSKLNQALAAGNFEEFVNLTTEFGIKAGPEASKQAAVLQKNIAALSTFTAGFAQRLTTAINGSEGFNTSLEFLISTIGGLSKLVENQITTLSSLSNAFFDAITSVMEFAAFFVTGFQEIEHTLLSSISGIINFKDTARQGFASAEDGLLGFVENTFLVGQSILKYLIIPIQAFVTAARVSAEFLDLEMAGSLKGLEKSLQSMNRSLDVSTNEGFSAFTSFSEGAKKSLDALRKTTTNTTIETNGLGSSLNDLKDETKETTEEMRTLNNVLNDIFSKFVSFDVNKVIGDFQIVANTLLGLFEKIKSDFETITSGTMTVAENIFERLYNNVLIRTGNLIRMIQDKLSSLDSTESPKFPNLSKGLKKAIEKGGSFLQNIGGKFGNIVSQGISVGASTAITGVLAVLKIAESLGQRGKTTKEIQKSVEQDIRARAKAIEIGLQALPRILFDVLPKVLIEFVDRIIFGFQKGTAEFINIMINKFKALFTKDGLKNIGRSIKEGLKASFEEFFRRIDILGGIISKRGGGRIPSARGGIKFTGNQQGLALLHPNEFVVPESGQMPQAVERAMMKQTGGGINIVINAAVVENNAIDELVRQIERRFQTFGSSTSPLFGGI